MNEFFSKLLGLPVLASKQGQDVDALIIYVHWLMIVLFVGWMVYFAYALLRFRKTRHPKADYVGVKGHASNWIEGAVAVIEGVLLLGFAIPLWARAVDKFPKPEESTVIQIVAQQFAWNVRYAGADGKLGKQDMGLVADNNLFGVDLNDPQSKDDVQTQSQIHVPVNKPVLAHISSKDVIHSFKIIAMRVCQDAIPGLRIPTHFTPTKVGRYQINCAQLCGSGHSGMSGGFLIVDTEEDFQKWLAAQPKAGTAPTSFE